LTVGGNKQDAFVLSFSWIQIFKQKKPTSL